jgi:Protein of unknown function (DUF3443)
VRANLLAALIGMLSVTACGGGSLANGGNGGGGTPTGANVQAIAVDSGPPEVANSNQPAINTAYTTVIVCSPGSATNCQTIDHIQVDTGSSGLRILGSVLTITLPLQTDSNNNVLAECTQFVDGSSWGPIRQADVKIAGETASNQEVQVIGDAAYPTVPQECLGNPPVSPEDSVTSFGAKGILGVGPFITDCGPSCEQPSNDPGDSSVYYTCTTASACSASGVQQALQVSNPVASFTADNNGVIIKLPSIAAAGAAAVSGYLIFGIDTQSNNALGGAKVLLLGGDGLLTTNYNQSTLQRSFIDSGSNAYFFPAAINPCPGDEAIFYCPASTLALSATMVSQINGMSAPVSFSVANAQALFSSGTVIAAASNLAATSSVFDTNSSDTSGNFTFDWGLPFFFGRSVYTAIENRNTSGGTGPYFAF